MNERIKELAKQAGGNPNYKAFFGHFLPPPPDYIDPATVDLEKFAELIVDECCLKLLDMDEKTKGNHNYYKHAALEVKKHFGVEL